MPQRLPALSASRELQDRASALGYDWPTLDGVLEKLDEELGELSEALTAAGTLTQSRVVQLLVPQRLPPHKTSLEM